MDTSVYFGVYCRRCDNRIALVEVISGPKIYQWFVPRIPPFEVRCESCGTSRTYRYRHVIVFEAPALENLETHPAFRHVWHGFLEFLDARRFTLRPGSPLPTL